LRFDRDGEDIHELLAELGAGLRVDFGALQGQRGAEFDGDAAQPRLRLSCATSGGSPDANA